MKKIRLSEIELQNINIDKIGAVFSWKNRILRGIKKKSVKEINAIFESGLIDELSQQKLFPKSWITDYQVEGFDLVIEHEKVEIISYPHEWSFSMFKDAAIAILKINQIANKHGYKLEDIHSCNIAFNGMSPVFLDLGGFAKFSTKEKQWSAYRDFLENYLFILKIWSNGNKLIARTLFLDRFKSLFTHEFLLYKHPFFRFFKLDFFKTLINAFYSFRFIESIECKLIKKRFSGVLGKILCFLKKLKILPFQKTKYYKLTRKINKLSQHKINTQWKNYHTEIEERANPLETKRIDRIAQIVQEKKIKTVVELAGNQGMFSKYLLKNAGIQRAVCTDYDEEAVDLMYQKNKKSGLKLTPIILDFIRTNEIANSKNAPARFKSEAVLSLAVTHHLILTQKIPLDYIFKTIAKYSSKYVFIEFMPLGLYNGDDNKTPPLPDWYNINWFRNNFVEYFNLEKEENLEKNRTLFFGTIKN